MKNKKELIFDVVINHIKTKGHLSGLTISEIAKKADIGKGTIYEYFCSKDELIAETMIYMLDEIMKKIIESDNTNLDFKNTLCSHIETVMAISKEYTNLETIVMNDDLGNLMQSDIKKKMMHKIIEIKKDYQNYLNSILEKGISEGVITKKIEPYLTYIIGSIIMSSVTYYYHEKHYEDDITQFINKVYNLIIKLLK